MSRKRCPWKPPTMEPWSLLKDHVALLTDSMGSGTQLNITPQKLKASSGKKGRVFNGSICLIMAFRPPV